MFNEVGSSPLVSGFFWDDHWTATEEFSPDLWPNTTQDMGLTQSDLDQLTVKPPPRPAAVASSMIASSDFFIFKQSKPVVPPYVAATRVIEQSPSLRCTVLLQASYNANMAALQARTIAEGKFSWQMLWSGPVDQPGNYGGTCPEPLVRRETCAADLRALCAAASPQYGDRALMYSFGPGGCQTDPSDLADFDQDLANFLLVRGPYAWLGHGWLGCSRDYSYPDALAADYGEPTELCTEDTGRPGVFTREWTKATVEMDCGTWIGTVDLK